MSKAVVGFDWDEGNWPKCGKHGVSRAEIENIFRHGPLIVQDRTGALETRLNAVGVNADRRHIFIVFALRLKPAGTVVRPISARYMHGKEIQTYEAARQA